MLSTSVPAVLTTSTGHALPGTHASEGARLCDTTLKIAAVVRGAMAMAYNPGWDVWSSSLTRETENLGALFRATKGGQDWLTSAMVLPGESQGRGSLVGCRLWGRTESDTTEAT